MSGYRIDNGLAALAMAGFIFSCGLVDLRPVVISTEPEAAYATLPSRDDCLLVRFSAEPDRLMAERAFSVRCQDGAVEGDFLWKDDTFSWKPASPWDPGMRYRLIFKGVVEMKDGREARPEIDIPFFVVRSAAGPRLVSCDPSEGSSTGTAASGQSAIRMVFDERMDARTVEGAFSVKPSFKTEYRWNDIGTEMTVAAAEPLEPCTVYRWRLDAGARSVDGSPVTRVETGSFITDLDTTPPRVERVYPVIFAGGEWVTTGESLDDLNATDSIAVLFSEPVKAVSARAGIRLQPNSSGYVEAVSSRLFIFCPERGWPPEQPRSLVVSADIVDDSGLRAGTEFRSSFTPSVPYLSLRRLSSGLGGNLEDPRSGQMLALTVGEPPEGKAALIFSFSSAFDAIAKADAVERISLAAFFPGSLPGPSLRDVAWVSDDTLVMTWEGLRAGSDDQSNYYKIIIPGGIGGVVSASGLILEEEVAIYLEARR